jgi:hypothetical protein
MKISIIYGLIAAVIAWFFMYLDTRLLDNPKTKTTYIKNMMLIGGIVGFGVHLIGEDTFKDSFGGQGGSGGSGHKSSYLSDYGEEMLTGNPDF